MKIRDLHKQLLMPSQEFRRWRTGCSFLRQGVGRPTQLFELKWKERPTRDGGGRSKPRDAVSCYGPGSGQVAYWPQ